MNSHSEPTVELPLAGKSITLLGTAHISKASADKVKELLDSGHYDCVAVELCPDRHQAILNPDDLANLDLFQVFRGGRGTQVLAHLALSAYQQRLARELGIEPGAEMRMALEIAQAQKLPVLLIDRRIAVTLKRVYANLPWWKRLSLVAGLLLSAVFHEKIDDAEIERLKQGDMLEATLYQFAERNPRLFLPLIEERDRYMVAQLRQQLESSEVRRILVVIGAGHLKGMQTLLAEQPPTTQSNQQEIDRLEQIPPARLGLKIVPWLIVLLVLAGFGLGFSRSSDLGWQMVMDWVLINGGLSAFGAMLAAAHPLTIATAFLAAPLTSLNPMIGAGMVTASIEVFLRKPSVGDFSRLRNDATRLGGWWKNRVARTLLVFLFSTLGSAAGTYIAGFRIFERLF